jgi:preprotein translocase subunit YajC
MKHTLLFLSLFVVMAVPALAQETFRVGDMVETADGRQCRIESITGSSAKVKCGPNSSDIRVYSFQSLISVKTAALRREQQQQRQQQQTQPAAQTLNFRQGDTVQTPDGRTGKIESFKDQEMAKVRFGPGANDAQYFMLTDLKVVPPPKPPRTEPIETFSVGDMVEDENGKQYRIESINGNTAKLRFGPGRYNVRDELLENLMSVKMAAAKRERENAGKIIRAQFEDEARPYAVLVRSLAHAYDPKFRQEAVAITDKPATYEKWRKDLESLSAICQKYPTLTNRPGAEADNISQNPADWCKLAEQRTAVLKKMNTTLGEHYAGTEVHSWTLKIDQTIRNRSGHVKDDVQMLLYDRAAWEQKELPNVRKKYADAGESVPPNLFASLDEKVNELKALIERDAPTRSWTQPPYTDAALEGMARRAYPAQSPGVKVYKTGMTFTTWKAMDDTSLVGSGTDYKLYRTTKGAYRYKLGLALVKLPNQPFCQIRDFQVQQDKAGAGYSAARLHLPLGYTGIFVKCP